MRRDFCQICSVNQEFQIQQLSQPESIHFWDHLRNLNAQGKTILFTSHYLEEVEALCDTMQNDSSELVRGQARHALQKLSQDAEGIDKLRIERALA